MVAYNIKTRESIQIPTYLGYCTPETMAVALQLDNNIYLYKAKIAYYKKCNQKGEQPTYVKFLMEPNVRQLLAKIMQQENIVPTDYTVISVHELSSDLLEEYYEFYPNERRKLT